MSTKKEGGKVDKCKSIKGTWFYSVMSGGLPVVNVCLVKTRDGKFHRGTAMCNKLDEDVIEEHVLAERENIESVVRGRKPVKKFLMSARMQERGEQITGGRATKAVNAKSTSSPVSTIDAQDRIFSIKGAKDAFTLKNRRLWKCGYNVSLSEYEEAIVDIENGTGVL